MAKGQALYEDAAGQKQELQPELMSIMKEEVGKARERHLPIIRAFEAIAQRSGLKSNTIRNYYYRYLHDNEEMKKEVMQTTDGDNLSLSDSIGRPFTPEETKALMREMLIAQARGESVRGCANRLSKGDQRVLIRLQNKYRSIIAREPEYVESLIKEIESEGIECFNPYTKVKMVRSGRKAANVDGAANGQLIDWISQFVNNMNRIKAASLNDLVKGLRDLSGLAAGNTSFSEYMSKHSQELQELNNRILLLEVSLDKERREANQTNAKLSQLMEINRRFMEMSDPDKLAGLKDYMEQLQSYMDTGN
jgi:hypothetical protein